MVEAARSHDERGRGMANRTSSRVLLIVAAFVLLLVPVAAIAAGGFDDVGDDNVYKADIQWLADVGVTKGCNPPSNTEFCPSANVTREQMAAFMHRLAVNRVVDAATAATADNASNADRLDGNDSTAFAVSGHDHDADYLAIAGKAADADKLDGKDSTAFLDSTGKAADADLLDGKDSTAFVLESDLPVPLAGYDGTLTYHGYSKNAEHKLNTVALNPAADGKAVATFSVVIEEETAGDQVWCGISATGAYEHNYAKPYTSIVPPGFGVLAGTRGFDVVGGSPLTVDLFCIVQGGNSSPTSMIGNSDLTVVFVPNP
jgi:hypothetical protein